MIRKVMRQDHKTFDVKFEYMLLVAEVEQWPTRKV